MIKNLSYSNFSLLRQCGRKYKLRAIDKTPEPKAVVLEFGSALHAGLACSLETKQEESAEFAMDVFQAYWDGVATYGLDYDGRFGHDFLGQMGLKFVANFHKRYAKNMKLIIGEQRMYAEYGLHNPSPKRGNRVFNLEGTPDALVEWGGKNVLLDFKSSAYNYLEEKSDCSLQLNLYAWLLESNNYKVDELAYVVFTKTTGSIQTIKRVPYDKNKALTMIEEMLHYVSRNDGHYERNPNNCIMGKSVCPYFSRCWNEPKTSTE